MPKSETPETEIIIGDSDLPASPLDRLGRHLRKAVAPSPSRDSVVAQNEVAWVTNFLQEISASIRRSLAKSIKCPVEDIKLEYLVGSADRLQRVNSYLIITSQLDPNRELNVEFCFSYTTQDSGKSQQLINHCQYFFENHKIFVRRKSGGGAQQEVPLPVSSFRIENTFLNGAEKVTIKVKYKFRFGLFVAFGYEGGEIDSFYYQSPEED